MIRKAAVGAVLALVAGLGSASRASAYTIVDLEKVALIQGGLVAPVTIPCGGERIDLRGRLAVHVLIRDDGTLDYHVNALDASGVGAVTGTRYRLVGAAAARPASAKRWMRISRSRDARASSFRLRSAFARQRLLRAGCPPSRWPPSA